MKTFPEQGIFPVIHRSSTAQSIEMAGMAQELGAKGVFVIDHKSSMTNPDILVDTYTHIKYEFPNLWLGINNLALSAARNLVLARGILADGVWADNATESSNSGYVRNSTSQTVFFGGVAMKGPGYIEDSEHAAQYIHNHLDDVDVAVTSGPETGVPCPPERLEAIRRKSPDAKLAIASGVDLENIARHSRLVDYILVASSIETHQYSGVFLESALKEMIAKDAEARGF
ncbi:hypothetical protein KBD20_02020 [Candidatus Saccharibacteria bacterium]|nr:hypothetical protein [Candidatus Saccharibacteria bacterium]